MRNGGTLRRGVRVFFYHGLVERRVDRILERNFTLVSTFRDHLRLLRRFGILSLGELAEELRNGKRERGTATVLTFDDGYANNQIAAEMLSDAGIPWSIFVASGAIGRGGTTWPEELSLLVLHGDATEIEALEKSWPLADEKEREVAFRAILVALKKLPAAQRRRILSDIREQFPAAETQRLLERFPSLKMLSWEALLELSTARVDVCSHGVLHEIHHREQPAEIREEELRASKAELEARLGRRCDYFAFPNGDFDGNSAAEVEAAGFKLGFTTVHDTIRAGANPFLLPRFDPNNYGSLESFARNFFWQDGG